MVGCALLERLEGGNQDNFPAVWLVAASARRSSTWGARKMKNELLKTS